MKGFHLVIGRRDLLGGVMSVRNWTIEVCRIMRRNYEFAGCPAVLIGFLVRAPDLFKGGLLFSQRVADNLDNLFKSPILGCRVAVKVRFR